MSGHRRWQFIGTGNRRPVEPGAGGWIPISRLEGFEIWIARYQCGHGQLLSLCGNSRATVRTVLRMAQAQLHDGEEFVCVHCSYDSDNPGTLTRVADLRRLR